jgi:hypothetical protein
MVSDAVGVAGRVAAAIAALLYVAILVSIAAPLFLGEWIFGSLGWGIVHAVLLAIALAVVLVLDALRISRRYLGGTFLVAALLGIAVAVALGLSWPNAGYASIGSSVLPGIDAGVRPLAVGVIVGAVLLALAGLLFGARAGGGSGAIGGLFMGLIPGVIMGAFTAISFDPRAGVATGIAVGLLAWPLLGLPALRGYDWESLKRRFTPQASIDAAMDTKAFVEARLRRGKEEQA